MNKNYLMPKAELHCHLDGCIRTETVYHYNKIIGAIPKDTTSIGGFFGNTSFRKEKKNSF